MILWFMLTSLVASWAKQIKCVVAWPDNIFCLASRIADVWEFTALESESTRALLVRFVIIVAKVRVLHILLEISDQELASMTWLWCTESFGCSSTHCPCGTDTVDWEWATIWGQSGPLQLYMVDEVNRTRNAIISRMMSILWASIVVSLV